jgi:hypothetical protein
VTEQQLDLFSAAVTRVELPSRQTLVPPPPAVANLDDRALIAAIPAANLAESVALANEAGRRRLAAAVPAFAAVCGRFAGFGIDRIVPEQAAALQALSAIGGRDAAEAVSLMIVRGVVQGPALKLAVAVAAQLRATLPPDALRSFLRHDDPDIRANACRCARRKPELISAMIELLDDINHNVAKSAGCALGHLGRIEARPMLVSLLRSHPKK